MCGMIVSNVGGRVVARVGSGIGHADNTAPRRLVADDNAKFTELMGRKTEEKTHPRLGLMRVF